MRDEEILPVRVFALMKEAKEGTTGEVLLGRNELIDKYTVALQPLGASCCS